MGADRLRRGTQAGRRGSATEQAGVDWSNIDPYEEGRAGDLPYDDRVLFGDFASQLLNGAGEGLCTHETSVPPLAHSPQYTHSQQSLITCLYSVDNINCIL